MAKMNIQTRVVKPAEFESEFEDEDLRHLQCPVVQNITRRINALRDNEPYYQAYVKRSVPIALKPMTYKNMLDFRQTQSNQVRHLVKTVILIVGSIILYNISFGLFSNGCCLEDPSWLARKIGNLLGVKDRIYY